MGGRAAVAAAAKRAVSGNGGDDAVRPNPADPGGAAIGDIKAAVRCHGDAAGIAEACLGGPGTVAADTKRAVSGFGGDDAVRPNPADPAVAEIGDIKAAVRCHGDAAGWLEACLGGGAAVAAEAKRAVSGDGGDDAVRPNPADPVVTLIADIKAAVRCHGDAAKIAERCLGGRAAVAAEAPCAVAGNGGDNIPNRLCAAACTVPPKEHRVSRVISVVRAEAPSADLGADNAENALALLPKRDLLACKIPRERNA